MSRIDIPPPVMLALGLQLVPDEDRFSLRFLAGETEEVVVSSEALGELAGPRAHEILMRWAGQARAHAVVQAPAEVALVQTKQGPCDCPPGEIMVEVGVDRWTCAVCGCTWYARSAVEKLEQALATATGTSGQVVDETETERELLEAAAEVIAVCGSSCSDCTAGKDALARLADAQIAFEGTRGRTS